MRTTMLNWPSLSSVPHSHRIYVSGLTLCGCHIISTTPLILLSLELETLVSKSSWPKSGFGRRHNPALPLVFQSRISSPCHLSASSRMKTISGIQPDSSSLKINFQNTRRLNVSKTSSIPDMEDMSKTEEVILDQKIQPDGTIQKIVFATGCDIDVYDVQNLYEKVGWEKQPPIKIARSLMNCYMVASLHLIKETTDNGNNVKLIGIGRAISDHVVFASIWDVVVDPMYQGQGFGKALLEQMIRALRRRGVSSIYLFSTMNAVEFCEKLGFRGDSGGKGMVWHSRT